MDQAQWAQLSQVLRQLCRSIQPLPRVRYSELLIARLYFWAVSHDRPMTFATQRCHYTRWFRPRQVPSVSQLNRRVGSARFDQLLNRLHRRLAAIHAAATLSIDGKALCVSPVSQDRDARSGHIPGGMGKGYKLHAIVTPDGKIPVFALLPLNRHEMPVARVMLEQLPDLNHTLVLADGNYDAHVLHKQIAAAGGWLITKPRGYAAHPVTRRQMGPARRRLIDLWQRCPQLMRRIYRRRDGIERVFGQLSCTPGLLGPLPGFVRGLPRVRRWVGAKICLYHLRREARLISRQQAA